MEQFINVDLLEHGQDGHGVYSRDDGAKQQTWQKVHLPEVIALQLTHAVQHAADEEWIPQGSHHSKHKDGPQVLREGPDGQKIAGVQDYGRQQVEKEDLGVEQWRYLTHQLYKTTDQQTHHDEQTALGYDIGDSWNQMKPWEREKKGQKKE